MLKPKQVETVKKGAKVLQGLKVLSNTFGTEVTETPEVDTTPTKKYGENDGTSGDNSGTQEYNVDENGVGSLKPKGKKPKAY